MYLKVNMMPLGYFGGGESKMAPKGNISDCVTLSLVVSMTIPKAEN